MNRPNDGYRHCAVIMERQRVDNRWTSERWVPVRVDSEDPTADRVFAAEPADAEARTAAWRHPGFTIALYTDEAEGYYLNLTSPAPSVFVNWELTDSGGVPRSVTLSYNEAARQMDGGAQVDPVPMPADWLPWVARFVDRHYVPPEKKTRIRPPSFDGARRDGGRNGR